MLNIWKIPGFMEFENYRIHFPENFADLIQKYGWFKTSFDSLICRIEKVKWSSIRPPIYKNGEPSLQPRPGYRGANFNVFWHS